MPANPEPLQHDLGALDPCIFCIKSRNRLHKFIARTGVSKNRKKESQNQGLYCMSQCLPLSQHSPLIGMLFANSRIANIAPTAKNTKHNQKEMETNGHRSNEITLLNRPVNV